MKPINLSKAFIACSIIYSSTVFSQTVIGAGTTNTLPKFTAASTIGNSQITDNGTTVSLGTASVAIGAAAVTSGDFFTIAKNQNALTRMRLNNGTTGTAGSSMLQIGAVGANLYLASYNIQYTPLGIKQASVSVVESAAIGGLNVGSSTNSQLSFWTNNLKRMTVTSTGSVGIGTTTPDKWFTVKSAVLNTQIAKFADDARYIGLGRDEVAAFDLAGSPANLYLGGQKLTILTNGNIGIGTLTPTKKLQVVGDAQIDNLSFANFSNNSWMDASNALLLNYFSRKETNINTAWTLQTDGTTGITTIVQDGGQVNMGAKVALTSSLKLGWDGNGVDLSTAIEVNQNANYSSGVKIKTWNNSVKAYSINNGTSINPFIVSGGGNTTINGNVPSTVYFNINDVSNVGSPVQTFAVSANGYTKINSSTINAFEVSDATTSIVNFRVKNTGFVYAREVNVQLTAFPDYVFAKDYKLTPLNEVEQFIKNNHHLKGFEAAKQYESNGMNVGEVVKLQQEKIEELTLYLIEQQKQLEELKKQMDSFKK